MKKKLLRVVVAVFAALILAIAFIALRIYTYRTTVAEVQADAAIVLGAAVWGREVSPVFKERINHAVELYRAGKVRKIIFTGGQGNADELSESATARQYAIAQGIPLGDILVEERSHTTYENLLFARELSVARGLKRVLIVSDPLHMKRGVAIAIDLGLEAYPSPTPTTRYQGTASQLGLLAHETYYYIGYLFHRTFTKPPALEHRSENALRIGAVLPGNWDLKESDNQILISRNAPIWIYDCVQLDLGALQEPSKMKQYIAENGESFDYRIRLRFAPKLALEDYKGIKESNDKIQVTMLTLARVPYHEFSERDVLKSFDPTYRELPEYHDGDLSIYFGTTKPRGTCIHPEEVADECENVKKTLDSVFTRYSERPNY